MAKRERDPSKPHPLAHVPTPEQIELVRDLAAMGTPQAEIADRLGINPETLRRRYRQELTTAMQDANRRVYQTLFQMATSGECPSATIFYCKTRLGWSEKIGVQLSGNVGTHTIDPSKLSQEQLKALESILESCSTPES